jgi:hypothetical protein
MNAHKKILGLAAGLFLVLACGAPAATPDVAAIVAQTMQAITAAPTETQQQTGAAPAATSGPQQLTPAGTAVDTAEISFITPNEVANGASSATTANVEYPYINPSSGDMPQHIAVTLNSYAVNGSIHKPQILIFRASEYSQYSELTASIIGQLQSLQYADGEPLPEGLNAEFSAQVHAVNFKNGHGIRYLTQTFQNFDPVNNQELFYYYQGITEDGQYFVQAILPVNAPYLAADSSPNTLPPADGIPFNMDNFPGYLDAVSLKLNSSESSNFNPSLEALDEMISSMQIKGF